MKKLSLSIILLLAICSTLLTLEIGKVTLPDEMTLENDTLILNGAGLRKKLIIKVYAAGLYLTEASNNANTVLENDKAMALRMHFIYKKVSEEKLITAWNEGFGSAATSEELKPKVDLFNSFFSEPALKGDIYDIIYEPGKGTSVFMKGELKGTIEGIDFKKAVFSIWLGENTGLPKLREKLLGQ